MIQNYEIYCVFQATLSEETIDSQLTSIQSFLESEVKAKSIQIEKEGNRKLAYPINKSWNGYFTLITFDLELENLEDVNKVNPVFNLNENLIRYILVNQTEYNKQKNKEKLVESETTNHRELNKGKKTKECLFRHLGMKAVDYKDVDLLNQFVSPYGKIFGKSRSGTSSKFQRKVSQAIKRARFIGLIPFSNKHNPNF